MRRSLGGGWREGEIERVQTAVEFCGRFCFRGESKSTFAPGWGLGAGFDFKTDSTQSRKFDFKVDYLPPWAHPRY